MVFEKFHVDMFWIVGLFVEYQFLYHRLFDYIQDELWLNEALEFEYQLMASDYHVFQLTRNIFKGEKRIFNIKLL